jgi:hypothetical protein
VLGQHRGRGRARQPLAIARPRDDDFLAIDDRSRPRAGQPLLAQHARHHVRRQARRQHVSNAAVADDGHADGHDVIPRRFDRAHVGHGRPSRLGDTQRNVGIDHALSGRARGRQRHQLLTHAVEQHDVEPPVLRGEDTPCFGDELAEAVGIQLPRRRERLQRRDGPQKVAIDGERQRARGIAGAAFDGRALLTGEQHHHDHGEHEEWHEGAERQRNEMRAQFEDHV